MRKWFGKLLFIIVMCAVAASVVLIGVVYFDFISNRIYEDSADHLEEIYGQVNRSFGAFFERNLGLLNDWGEYFYLVGDSGSEEISKFIADEREYWGFSEFYFLSQSGAACMTSEGVYANMALGAAKGDLVQRGEPVMASRTTAAGQDITVFAIPVTPGRYKGFDYDALAVSYTNADMVKALNADAFSGKANCFVIRSDGSILLSAQNGGNVFSDYLAYLKAASDLGDEGLEKIQSDWQSGTSGLLQCKIGGVSSFIIYQPVGYRDYILLGAVPQNVVSAGFLSVQRTTLNALFVIFLIIGAVIITLIILRGRKQSRRSITELRYRERMFDVLSNSVNDIFIMLNSKDINVDYVSPNIERLLGIPERDVRENIRVMEKCALSDNIVIPKEELETIPLNGNRSWECEYVHQNTDERRWYKMTIYHMSIRDVKKYIVVMSDRTHEQLMNKQLQEALESAKSANEAKSKFLSSMSHDIRTPMNAIVGFAVLLEKDAEDAERVREYTRKITASSHHLLSLINDVLDMSKIESGKTSLNLDCFSIPKLIDELNIILRAQAKAKNQELKILVRGAFPEQIIGDKLRLNQILINILSNAIKYTPDGGKIEFIVSELPSDEPQSVKLRFAVRDNGIGMSEEFLQNIFAPFSREEGPAADKIQGTGLGMAITKNLVDLMGGVILVESKLGEGSTFTVEMSFALPEQEDVEAWFDGKIKRVLAADDEEEICLNIKELMRPEGVEVSYVTDGDAAVEEAVSAHGRGEDYDVILLDWKMPEKDGVETAREIRERVGGDVPILVLTSYDWSDIEADAHQAGINAFMSKPFFVSSFRQTLEPLFSDETGAETGGEKTSVLDGLLFLVAEDNELNIEILTELLSMEGARCEVAGNGQEAAEMFEKSESGHYDMILMDVQMPVMNGYDATRRIRASAHPQALTIPIAAMTANTFAEDVREAMDAGMDGHLAKPIDMEAVKELVGRLVKRDGKSTDGGDGK